MLTLTRVTGSHGGVGVLANGGMMELVNISYFIQKCLL